MTWRKGTMLGTLVALGVTVLAASCNTTPDCFEAAQKWQDPCPTGPNLTDFCRSSMSCRDNAAPATCDGDGCRLIWAHTFSIPLSSFTIVDPSRDLVVGGANPCPSGKAEPVIQATLDGVPGVLFQTGSMQAFRWDPFPVAPQRLDITYDNPDAITCFDAGLLFVDASCEATHQPPACPL